MDIISALHGNTYPGRGIFIGRSPNNEKAVIVYFIMGRSENSRNRVFVSDGEGVRTKACDPSKMKDPSLVIYSAVRRINGCTVVTNGDQTDPVCDVIAEGKSFEAALRTRTFEPDAPNFTPRISGIVFPDGSYRLSILKANDPEGKEARRIFWNYEDPSPGKGHLIHTYEHDGDPLPSFEDEPREIDISSENPEVLALEIWSALDSENKVSLYCAAIDIKTGIISGFIINKNEECA